MKRVGPLTITTPNDLEIVMTRVFDAPRTLVFDEPWYGGVAASFDALADLLAPAQGGRAR